jgi:formylglycine-generating enzyme required for sulfatase activity
MKKPIFFAMFLALTVLLQAQNAIPENFVRINSGTFTMGSPANESDRHNDEVQRQVTLSSFYMSKYEVTQREYEEIMGVNPSHFKGSDMPVEYVSWYDAIEYCNRRSEIEGLTPAYTVEGSGESRTVIWDRNANGYRLPTEAEWEYACRAGTVTAYSTGNEIADNTGWFRNNSGGSTRPVGQKPANAWGLHDMHGNVSEWCWDWYGSYASGAQTNPAGASSGTNRSVRGGSWYFSPDFLRSATRVFGNPSYRYEDLGFRLVRS